ncbi:MAG: hypothetical protein WCI22_13080, partial [Actinomycetota bacterium]
LRALVGEVQLHRSRLALAAADVVAAWEQHDVRLTLFDDARRLLQYWAHRANDELGLRPDRPAPSTLYASRSGDSGELALDGWFSAVDGEIIERELKRLLKELKREDDRNCARRTPARVRAAALVRMATRSVNATGVSARPLFQVIVGDLTTRRLCEHSCRAFGTPWLAPADCAQRRLRNRRWLTQRRRVGGPPDRLTGALGLLTSIGAGIEMEPWQLEVAARGRAR